MAQIPLYNYVCTFSVECNSFKKSKFWKGIFLLFRKHAIIVFRGINHFLRMNVLQPNSSLVLNNTVFQVKKIIFILIFLFFKCFNLSLLAQTWGQSLDHNEIYFSSYLSFTIIKIWIEIFHMEDSALSIVKIMCYYKNIMLKWP